MMDVELKGDNVMLSVRFVGGLGAPGGDGVNRFIFWKKYCSSSTKSGNPFSAEIKGYNPQHGTI